MKRVSRAFACGAALLVVSSLLISQTAAPVAPSIHHALDAITAANLKGDLSFLASDALQGRYTPSPGLEVAAEFIAAQFRAAGLEPGGDEEYFQIANMIDRRMPALQSPVTLEENSQTHSVPTQSTTVTDTNAPVKIEQAPVLVIKGKDPASLKGIELTGKAIVVAGLSAAERHDFDAYRRARSFDQAVNQAGAALEITVEDTRAGPPPARLIEAADAHQHRVPSLSVASDELQKWVDQAADATLKRSVSVDIPGPQDQNVTVKNVIDVLPGSDPALKKTYVMLTAHYDHIGTTDTADRQAAKAQGTTADHIYNGANDDGSGTVSVVEIAKALAGLNPRPKRSIIFMTFFGEERGLLGSQFYGHHPRFPVAETVADLNLEQVGRTDSTEGPQINTASLTGFDYSDVTKYLETAGHRVGVRVYLNKSASDPYFVRSDNAALALLGVPAETLCVAFDYPDYHGLGDEWQKIDYENMARVDRMVALGLIDIANASKPPEWNAANLKTAPFREAQKKLLGNK